jgi:GntR family transcriptional regulator
MVIELDLRSPVPIYQQIVEQLKKLIAVGALRPGDKLPTVREIAVQARVNRNTSARAIQILESQGIVHTRVGQGTFVSDEAPRLAKEETSTWLEDTIEKFFAEAESRGVSPEEICRKLTEKSCLALQDGRPRGAPRKGRKPAEKGGEKE